MLLCYHQFRVGGPQSPFSISSSFILFFVSLPFFLKTKLPGWRPSIAFLYLFLFHSLVRLTSFLSQKPNFRVGDPQSPFSISSSFILFFVSIPFFLKTKLPGWRPSIAILYLFLFHSLLRLTSFLSQNQNSGLATLNRLSQSLPLSFSSSPHFLSFSKPTQFRTRNTISNTCWPSSLGYLVRERRAASRKVSFLYLFIYLFFYVKRSSFSCSRSMIEYARKGERIGREMTGGVV